MMDMMTVVALLVVSDKTGDVCGSGITPGETKSLSEGCESKSGESLGECNQPSFPAMSQ